MKSIQFNKTQLFILLSLFILSLVSCTKTNNKVVGEFSFLPPNASTWKAYDTMLDNVPEQYQNFTQKITEDELTSVPKYIYIENKESAFFVVSEVFLNNEIEKPLEKYSLKMQANQTKDTEVLTNTYEANDITCNQLIYKTPSNLLIDSYFTSTKTVDSINIKIFIPTENFILLQQDVTDILDNVYPIY